MQVPREAQALKQRGEPPGIARANVLYCRRRFEHLVISKLQLPLNSPLLSLATTAGAVTGTEQAY